MLAPRIETIQIIVKPGEILLRAALFVEPSQHPDFRNELARDWKYEMFGDDGKILRTISAGSIDFTNVTFGSIEFDVKFPTGHDYGLIRRASTHGVFLDYAAPVTPFGNAIIKDAVSANNGNTGPAVFNIVRRASFFDYVEVTLISLFIVVFAVILLGYLTRNK
jgi:hypothetical protein